jgi:hypothetical protein
MGKNELNKLAISNKTKKKNLLPLTPTPSFGVVFMLLFFAVVVHSFLSYVAHRLGCGGRSCRGESESERPAADPGPVEGVRARRRSPKSPRAWGEPCFSVHHSQRVSFPCAPPAFRLTLRPNARLAPPLSLLGLSPTRPTCI